MNSTSRDLAEVETRRWKREAIWQQTDSLRASVRRARSEYPQRRRYEEPATQQRHMLADADADCEALATAEGQASPRTLQESRGTPSPPWLALRRIIRGVKGPFET